MYKKVFQDEDIYFQVANLANASRLKSITNEMANVVSRANQTRKLEYTEKKSAEVSAIVAKGAIEHEGKFQIEQRKDPLEDCLDLTNKSAHGKKGFIVLDNLEAIFSDVSLMRELGDILVLLDDPAYSKYKVRFLLVGVPSGVRDYFEKTQNRETVGNRLQEVSEVTRLGSVQVAEFLKKGFCDELIVKFAANVLSDYQHHIHWVTDGIPQRVHEYCLELAYLIEDNGWSATKGLLVEADKRWLKAALSQNYNTIESLMNDRATKAGRRNQVLFSLGQIKTDTFHHSDVERMLRKEFPQSTAGITLDVPGVLAQIADHESPPIRKTAKGDSYRYVDPKFRMCLRTMLVKEDEKVRKMDYSSVN